jgi:tetratricopeptide (TPR) repeat protein
VRAAAEAGERERRESAARDAQLWRDLGLLESARSVQAAIDAYEKARALDPADFSTLIFLSRLHRSANHLGRALERAEAARPIAAATSDPQRNASVASDEIGDVLIARNDLEGALTNYREGLEIRRRLASADPTNGERLRDVYVSLWKLAESGGGGWADVVSTMEEAQRRGLFNAHRDGGFLEEARRWRRTKQKLIRNSTWRPSGGFILPA